MSKELSPYAVPLEHSGYKLNLLINARYQMKQTGGRLTIQGKGNDTKVSFYASDGRACVVWFPTESPRKRFRDSGPKRRYFRDDGQARVYNLSPYGRNGGVMAEEKTYEVFVRDWWRIERGRRVPNPGADEEQLATGLSYSDAPRDVRGLQ